MFTSTKWRATLISQARYTEVPLPGSLELERWLFAQHAGRAFISHAWDCYHCNPTCLPPECVTTRSCPEAENLFRDFLSHAEKMGLNAQRSKPKSRLHKANVKDRYTEKTDSSQGHLIALCADSELQKKGF